jgi:hypothetical protein
MRSPFRVIHDRPVMVTIRFNKKVAGYIKEKIWHHTRKVEAQKDGSIVSSAEIAATDEVKHWVLSWGEIEWSSSSWIALGRKQKAEPVTPLSSMKNEYPDYRRLPRPGLLDLP